MEKIVLNEKEYYEKVYGGWLGKNIGGTLGVPVEGVKELLALDFYPVLPDEPLENDDLDLQLVWLHALEQYGPHLNARQLGQEWLDHIFFPFDEYGYALGNLRRGLLPPVAGRHNNPFVDCMGSPIRSEIWAMVSPGAPGRAAAYAREDAIVDHAGGEGVYGEMFFAAIESAAFVESDRDTLIAIGLSYIPASCRTARAVNDLLGWHAAGIGWQEARALVLKHHGSDNFTDAPQNIAFTILGWLYGEDFGDALLKAVNCGYDTDCTAATLGAILGIVGGRDSLPDRWIEPVGHRVVVSPPVNGFSAPSDLDELTRRTLRIGRQVLAAWELPVRLSAVEPTSGRIAPSQARPLPHDQATSANLHLLPPGSVAEAARRLTIEYGAAGPSIGTGCRRTIEFELANDTPTAWTGTAELRLPDGWSGGESSALFVVEPGASASWTCEIAHGGEAMSHYSLALLLRRRHNGRGWSEESVPFALVAAPGWTLTGPDGRTADAVFHGNLLSFADELGTEAPGTYAATTVAHIPTHRKVRWIAATEAPVTVRIDGETVISCEERTEYMPALHRALQSKLVELEMEPGEHRIELIATKGEAPLQVFFVPAATAETQDPGPYDLMIDIVFHP
ncbi:ADP-ribosylglycohydrolase family protein [Cohnella sp. GCM10020058]|uniref:ADP-ribosylglycohydrolase family protein n=1 Tax=Cohnella sp. GCM10020058 TaxID=3317330 RepID=UPI003635DC87